jgi:hypothetical protein
MITRSLLTIWVIFLSFAVLGSSERCQDEEPLPTVFEVNKLGDFHLHGEFRTNFLTESYVNFTINSESYFRILLDEHPIADVDLYLRRLNDSRLMDYSINYFQQEMIGVVLAPGYYALEIFTYTVLKEDDVLEHICQKIDIEVAIATTDLTNQSMFNFISIVSMLLRELN